MAQDPEASGTSNPTNRPEREQETSLSTIISNAQIPTKIWTVFEDWQNTKLRALWRDLATFSNHSEAVKYAQAYVLKLERMTALVGEWQSTQRSEKPNGDQCWVIGRSVPPANIASTVRVIGSKVHDRAEEAKAHRPMGFTKAKWEELQSKWMEHQWAETNEYFRQS
ncbi:hypothetical protein LTR37_003561 [Vermiconidia calcicola]|uniref:Uncharacterized protein n=1 Tax=Vermiconidia calcicola TaxID=1690605 RepID=A0ACC3NQ71_9PEZI|nr:hypothetical protein LTR37_003561 [Vermiconidia calcicola]